LSAAIEAYYREARTWDADRTDQMRRTTRAAWWVAGAACTCATAGGIALAALMPLKRTDPFLVRVDNSTGIVDVVPIYVGGAHFDAAVTRYFLSHYVTVCERFNFTTAESDYEECGSFNSPQRNQAWYARWVRSNPDSPLNVHKDGSSVRAQVTSVSFLGDAAGAPEIAQVRYLRVERRGAESAPSTTHWIATVRFAYVAPAGDVRARAWNPLGFRVVAFQAEPEALDEATAKGLS